MSIFQNTILFLSLLLFASCQGADERDSNEGLMCIEYDVRQCQQDIFADEVFSTGDILENMASWLRDQGVEVKEVTINNNAYDGVCEACGICPETWRFIAVVESNSTDLFADFDLLHYTVNECD